jgi:hypothetical protein
MEEQHVINSDFNFLGRKYTAEIRHYDDLSAAEIEKFNIKENTFLAHIAGSGKDIYFELYIAEDLEWYSTTDFDGPAEFIAILGRMIDSYYA